MFGCFHAEFSSHPSNICNSGPQAMDRLSELLDAVRVKRLRDTSMDFLRVSS
jgi:hypothetical protein